MLKSTGGDSRKEKNYRDYKKFFDRVKDDRGKKMDDEIKELVIYLNLLGFMSTGSCYGHLDSGDRAPYVYIESADSEKFNQKLSKVYWEIYEQKEDETVRIKNMERLTEFCQENRDLLDSAKRGNQTDRNNLKQLLNQFYTKRPAWPDEKITVNTIGLDESLFMENVGRDLQVTRPPKEAEAKLMKYRQEFDDLALFLKNIYWSK